MTVPSNWYENFFHGVPLDLWRKAISPEQTKAETDFLIAALHCHAGSHLLDVPCGNGRLALELARHGYRVTGVDISKEFIEEAGESKRRLSKDQPPATAGGSDWSPPVEIHIGDMRRVEGNANYDGAFCFWKNFGYFIYLDIGNFFRGG